MKFSYQDASRARAMRRKSVSQETIISFFKGKYSQIELDWLVKELRTRNDDYRKANYVANDWSHLVVTEKTAIAPPYEVLAQREQRTMLRPLSVTALLMGDPLPGESALDRTPHN